MREAVAIIPTATCLLLVIGHPLYHADLIVNNLLDILLVVVQVLPVTSQPNILTVELLLDDIVPLFQTLYQCLVHWGQGGNYPVGTW